MTTATDGTTPMTEASAHAMTDAEDGQTDAAKPAATPSSAAPMGDFREQLVGHLPKLRVFARILTGNRERADDLVHDTVLRALAAERQFIPGTNMKAWLITILRNQHISDLRRKRIRVESMDLLPDSALPTPATQHASAEFTEVRRALMKMSLEHREVLMLVAAAGFSYEEAAQICNCAIGTVKSRLNRGRAELQRLLSQEGVDPKSNKLAPLTAG